MTPRAAALAALFLAPPATAQIAPAGASVTPNAGAVTGEGVLNDHDGHTGVWRITAVLSNGRFTGAGTVELNGQTVTGPLSAAQSYLENGKCYFEIEQGRSHVHLGGPCTTAGVAGRLNGYIAGTEYGSVEGEMSGTLQFARAGAATPARGGAAAAAGTLPTRKLKCGWMERIGGNVGGEYPRYEWRYSAMVSLTLSPGGRYTTGVGGGSFARAGGAIRLTSGPFAGAVGQLQPDKSGQPAVYFEREDNRRADGSFIIDAGRTSCTG
ncbi:MAG: hypothetical protein JSR79_14345 [Proteobacteria bacterium]|nr:hypothetical protein [Pseudomonadota bacterium]